MRARSRLFSCEQPKEDSYGTHSGIGRQRVGGLDRVDRNHRIFHRRGTHVEHALSRTILRDGGKSCATKAKPSRLKNTRFSKNGARHTSVIFFKIDIYNGALPKSSASVFPRHILC